MFEKNEKFEYMDDYDQVDANTNEEGGKSKL